MLRVTIGSSSSGCRTPSNSSPFSQPNVPAANYNMALSQAKVKSVISGDSIILCSVSNPVRRLSLLAIHTFGLDKIRKDFFGVIQSYILLGSLEMVILRRLT